MPTYENNVLVQSYIGIYFAFNFNQTTNVFYYKLSTTTFLVGYGIDRNNRPVKKWRIKSI